ncbi:hypothetical protein RN001_009616 [Aquatica leii]|uniref:Uncharacterized protein n=1 Tax=Aquatica leii TaxID=1421715 RepID=A0AAN7SQ05_9COLE|nr:hypothetical protein RN001_009616 [Aquatica leii]
MAVTLYTLDASPVVRAVLITAEAIGLKLKEHPVDLLNEEHLTEKYLKLNPLHTVPTLDDNGNVLYDSHVINSYIVDKYGKNDSLYPKDFYKRGLVQQGMFFNLGYIFPVLKEIDFAYLKKEITCLTPRFVEMCKTVYALLETILKKHEWMALDHVTLADISCYTTITSLDYHFPIKPETYPTITNWVNRCAKLPYFKNDPKKLQSFVDLMKSLDAKPYKE